MDLQDLYFIIVDYDLPLIRLILRATSVFVDQNLKKSILINCTIDH